MPSPSNVTVPFTQGLSLKVDRRDAPIGSALVLQNALLTRPGELAKRPGWQALTSQVLSSAENVSSGAALAQLYDELFLFDGNLAYSNVPGSGWLPKGSLASIQVQDQEIVRNNYELLAPCVAVLGDLAMYCYIDATRGGGRVTVQSLSTGNTTIYDQLIDSTITCIRCVAFAGVLVVIYTEGLDVKYRTVIPSQPNVLQPEVVAWHGLVDQNNQYFDCTVANNRLYVAWNYTTEIIMGFLNSALAPVGLATLSVNPSVQAIACDSGGTFWLAYFDGTSPQLAAWTADLSTLIGQVSFLGLPPPSLYGAATLAETDPVSHTMTGLYTVISPTQGASVYRCQFTLGGVPPSLNVMVPGCRLASKLFIQQGQPYVAVQWQSPEQATLFVVSVGSTYQVIAKDRYTTMGPAPSGAVSNIVPLGDNSWLLAVTSGQAPSGIGSMQLSFLSPATYFNCVIDQNAFVVGGGGLMSYDGVQFVEQNFYLFPEGVTVAAALTPGNLSAGTYSYSVVYSWQDNNGQTVRSSVSVPVQITFVGAGEATVVTVPTLRITNRVASQVNIEVYRTQADGSIASLNLVGTVANNSAVASVTFTDAMSDIIALAQASLYSNNGAVVDYSPAPPCSLCVTFQNRVWVAGIPGQPNTLAYSNLSTPGQALEFNDDNRFTLDSLGGPITALGIVNDQLAVFKERSIFLVYGNGNDQGGNNGNLADQNLASDVGCVEPNSLVLIGNMDQRGLLFKSDKGIYSLSGQQQPVYIGADVEPYNSQTITSAVLCADQNVVRFTLADVPYGGGTLPNQGVTLVYDYFVGQWLIFTGLDAADSVVYNGVHTLLKSNGQVWQETESSANYFDDPYGGYSMAWESNEISPFGALGLYRPREVYVNGEYVGPHTLQVSFAYDGADWMGQVGDINATQVFTQQVGVYGTATGTSGSLTGSYGTSTLGTIPGAATYGGIFRPYTCRFNATRPCVSMRVRIEEVQPILSGGLPATNSSGAMTLSTVKIQCKDLERGPYLPDSAKS